MAAASPPSPGDPKPAWERFLGSSGGTALITVVIGGIVGSVITGLVQASLKQREYQQQVLKAQADQALVAYSKHAEGEIAAVRSAFETIGASVASAESLIALTEPRFAPGASTPESRQRIAEQRQEIRAAFNKADEDWRTHRDTLGLLITYYHQGSPAVRSSWRSVQDAVDGLTACAVDWYTAHPEPVDTRSACSRQQEAVNQSLDSLTTVLSSSRFYPWQHLSASPSTPSTGSISPRPD